MPSFCILIISAISTRSYACGKTVELMKATTQDIVAPADAKELSTHTEVFENLTTYEMRSFSLGAGSEIQPVLGCRVTANFFDVLSVSPTAGRVFSPGEEQPGSDQVAIVSRRVLAAPVCR